MAVKMFFVLDSCVHTEIQILALEAIIPLSKMCRVFLLFVAASLMGSIVALPTVPELNSSAYIGRWYQVYSNYWSNLFSNLFNPECATADYGAINATYISVRNSNFETATDARRTIEGVAWIPSFDEPGKLKLILDGVPIVGDYWIFQLGPLVGTSYQYSLITDADDRQLFVLCRDVDEFMKLYDTEVRKYLDSVGFRGQYKGPLDVPHPDNCQYLDMDL
ncbi:uncharacterized protein [Amphiura filiformis]|uniref:uncharacterized protein n=1 Tax=Amphiura filiformis TaxID=82378 RepID=UPI003B226458